MSMDNEEIFNVLRTKGKEFSDWLAENFNPYTAIVITAEEIKITEAIHGLPINKEIKNEDI